MCVCFKDETNELFVRCIHSHVPRIVINVLNIQNSQPYRNVDHTPLWEIISFEPCFAFTHQLIHSHSFDINPSIHFRVHISPINIKLCCALSPESKSSHLVSQCAQKHSTCLCIPNVHRLTCTHRRYVSWSPHPCPQKAHCFRLGYTKTIYLHSCIYYTHITVKWIPRLQRYICSAKTLGTGFALKKKIFQYTCFTSLRLP